MVLVYLIHNDILDILKEGSINCKVTLWQSKGKATKKPD